MQIILGLVALASCWLSILALRDGGGGKKLRLPAELGSVFLF